MARNTGSMAGCMDMLQITKNISPARSRLLVASGLTLALAACGGGGGGSRVSPAPPPPPVATPSPAPTPAPPTNSFDTQEVRRSDGPQYHGAVTAWQNGTTGQGQTIAIIDTGIDRDSPEFAGRISPASRDLAGNASFEAEDDHGTNVALIAAAALDGQGVVGIAHRATIMALRADRPGSCATQTDENLDGCEFFDTDIARGVDAAVAAGARVVNISLGGGMPTGSLRSAVARAAQAGVVIVVAAGNDGGSTDTDVNAGEPDPFAAGLLAAGGGNVIIVGSVNENGGFSPFSNRAGSQAAAFLSARGEAVCCVYENGQLKIGTEPDGSRFVTLFSGTSFATPQVSGAVALLAQAFPNLTGAQIVRILLDTARDAGDVGQDATYGRGILDIARALAPQGRTGLAGTTAALRLDESTAVASPAMGDALAGGSARTILIDGYGRAYGIDLVVGMSAARPAQRLRGAVERHSRTLAAGSDAVSLALTIGPRAAPTPGSDALTQLTLTPEQADGARVLAASAAMRIAPRMRLGVAFAQGADGLVAQLQGQEQPAFRIASAPSGDDGFHRADDFGVALRHEVGRWGLTASMSGGDAFLGNHRFGSGDLSRARERHPVASVGLAADRRFGPVETSLAATWLDERDTVLGGFFHPAVGVAGADTLFLDARTSYRFAPGWSLGAAARYGVTRADGGSARGGIATNAIAMDLTRTGVFQSGDTFGFRLAQPLRVSGGGLDLHLPVDYDYATESAIFGTRRLSLSPQGREVTGELAWSGGVWGGWAGASLFYRRQPGHIAAAPDDAGVAVSWSRGF